MEKVRKKRVVLMLLMTIKDGSDGELDGDVSYENDDKDE